MAEIGRWGGQKFEVKSGYVQGFTGLSIKGSSETEDKESGNEKYVSRKNGKPTEIGLTVHLNALTGCKNVRDTAMWFVNQARAGKKDYFYIKDGKLVPCQVMLTEASVKEIEMTNKGDWIMCDVQLTLKQCTKWDGTTGGGGGSSGGGGGGSSGGNGGGKVYTATVYYSASSGAVQSVTRTSTISYDDALKKAYAAVPGNAQWASTNPQQATNQTPTSTKTTSVVQKAATAVKTAATNIVNAATSVINKLVSAAKTASTAAKTTTTTTTTTVKKPAVTKKNGPTALMK